MKMLLAALGFAFCLLAPSAWAAPDPVVRMSVAVCDPNNPANCQAPNASGQQLVSGTVTAAGSNGGALATDSSNRQLVVGPAAAGASASGAPLLIGGTADGTGTGSVGVLKVDSSGNLFAQGNTAAGAADSGNGVKVSGVFNSTQPTLTNGWRGDLQVGSRGSLRVELFGMGSTNGAVVSSGTDGQAGQTSLFTVGQNQVFNGSNWDRVFACTNSAQTTVTAGNTTQIIAGSNITRVCAMMVGIATTGTFAVVQGTGSNCGTGTATIIPATNLTAGNVVPFGNGSAAVFRSGSGNSVCVTAATGNVSVYISYAQY